MISIPNGVDCPNELPAGSDSDAAEVLFVGRLTEQKAPLNLLAAFERLPEQLRAASRLTFVGDGPLMADLKRRIHAGPCVDSVQFVGQVDDVNSRMRPATLLVLPSRWEGMPNVVLEAMANGLPVVATAVDGTKEVLCQETGWLVPPDDVAGLSTAINDALTSPEERQLRRERAFERVRNEFTWQSVVDQYDKLFRAARADFIAAKRPSGQS